MKIKVLWHKGVNKPYVLCPVGFDGNTKPRPKYFDTKSAAADFAKVVNNWRAARKNPVIGEIKINEAETTLLAVLRQYEVRSVPQLTEILSHWTTTGPGAITRTSLRDAVEEYLAYYAKEKSDNSLTIADVTGKLRTFAAEYPGISCHEVNRRDIKEYLEDYETASTRNQHLKKLKAFFAWTTVEQFTATNQAENVDFSKVEAKDEIELYSVDQTAQLLNTADRQYPELLPWLAIQFFGYMRSAEIQKLDWSALDFEANVLTVSKKISKTKKRRPITISDQLKDWLTPYRKASGAVVEDLNGNVRKLFEAANIVRLRNAPRHTCCSVAAAALGETVGLTRIVQQAGHSFAIAKKHYWEAMTAEQAAPYLQIRREHH